MKSKIDEILSDLNVAILKHNMHSSLYFAKVITKLKELRDSIPTPVPNKK